MKSNGYIFGLSLISLIETYALKRNILNVITWMMQDWLDMALNKYRKSQLLSNWMKVGLYFSVNINQISHTILYLIQCPILKDSYIYILDEAVSNIDDYSKNCVLSAFDSIKENKILIIISHDLEVLANCDNIYVLKNGEIIEQGSNNDLLENNNLYSTLLNEQINLKNKFFAKEEF